MNPLVAKDIKSQLNPTNQVSAFDRSNRFRDGLEKVVRIWAGSFKIRHQGLQRPSWAPEGTSLTRFSTEDYDGPLEKENWREKAEDLQGSRDVGAQLFCALLRSVGVQTRLICSLQPLPFNAAISRSDTVRSEASLGQNTPQKKTTSYRIVSSTSPSIRPTPSASTDSKDNRVQCMYMSNR